MTISVCILQNLEKYRVLWTDFSASCPEINQFSVSKFGPEPAKPTNSLALVVTPQSKISETVLIRGHKICFHSAVWKVSIIIPDTPSYLKPRLLLSFIRGVFSSPELAQGELLGYRDVRRPSYVWTSVTSETYETSETSVRQLFSLCTL